LRELKVGARGFIPKDARSDGARNRIARDAGWL
jgi:hypothetical protein